MTTARRKQSLRRAVVVVAVCFLSVPALIEPAPGAASDLVSRYEPIVAEAAERFAIPSAWIRAVMDVESHGDARALSSKGAIGLMQVMPKTYDGLRIRYALGRDVYDPHDNIMAGAAYLREMYDRFGASGFLAAYNAGPERYQDYLTTARPLPLETRAYVAQLAVRLTGTLPAVSDTIDLAQDQEWPASALFAKRAERSQSDTASMLVKTSGSPAKDTGASQAKPFSPSRDALFIPLSGKTKRP
ncbi:MULTISPECIES: lytic transglycosylase domain-containing protein [unclassified Afipia]|nr:MULTISPECIES: lytic transglycosylase domain-containing protein [unclassified Afipia]